MAITSQTMINYASTGQSPSHKQVVIA